MLSAVPSSVAILGHGYPAFSAALECARLGIKSIYWLSQRGKFEAVDPYLTHQVLLACSEECFRGQYARGEVLTQFRAKLAHAQSKWSAWCEGRLGDHRVQLVDSLGEGLQRKTETEAVPLPSVQHSGSEWLISLPTSSGPDEIAVQALIEVPDATPSAVHLLTPKPDSPELEQVRMDQMQMLPKSIMVIGGAQKGAELASAFQTFGCDTTWIVGELGILPDFDRALANGLGDALMLRGVKLVHDKNVTSVTGQPGLGVLAKLDGGRTYQAEAAVITNSSEQGVIKVQTLASGPSCFSAESIPKTFHDNLHEQMAMGIALARRCSGKTATLSNKNLRFAQSLPQVAVFGTTPEQAAQQRSPVSVSNAFGHESIWGLLDPIYSPTVQLVRTNEPNSVLVGATAIGTHAIDILNTIGLMQPRAEDEVLVGPLASVTAFAQLAAGQL